MDRSGPNAVNFGKRGAETSQWKGDAIGYRAAHLRLMRWRGQPSECSSCGATGPGRRYEWALRKDASRVLLDDFTSMRGRTFSPDPDDYVRLCNPCHHTYDHGGEVLACKGCGVTFTTTRGNQLFCTKKCTNGYYNRLR